MTWWTCATCSVYWEEDTEASYSICWNCTSATGRAVPRLHVRYDTQHVMTFAETNAP